MLFFKKEAEPNLLNGFKILKVLVLEELPFISCLVLFCFLDIWPFFIFGDLLPFLANQPRYISKTREIREARKAREMEGREEGEHTWLMDFLP
jgi:hypothetical protein